MANFHQITLVGQPCGPRKPICEAQELEIHEMRHVVDKAGLPV